jgi:hypothetical protein
MFFVLDYKYFNELVNENFFNEKEIIKMSFDELQSSLTKLKVDMKDISIFRSIKQLYDEMMVLQNEINRVDGEIDKMVGDLYGIK